MDADTKNLQNILSILPLQESVNTLRTQSTGLYRRLIKQAYTQELNNLLHCEIELEHNELKLPDPKQIPPLPETTTNISEELDEFIKNCESTAIGLALL